MFEVIDNYLYLASLGCMVMENYLLEDRTPDYITCANNLHSCLSFYDQIYSQLDKEEYSEQEVDTLLACLIQSLKQETLKSISRELKECTRGYLPNADRFVSDYLMHDQKGNIQELTASVLITFIRRLRESETAYAEGK